jgi:DNA-binding NtrC family response regulator
VGRILLIDGDPGERLILRSRLAEAGHEILVAESGAKGLAEARAGTADLVLLSTDLGGGVDGAEVCRRLKATPGLNRLPVVVYSHTPASTELADRMYDAGCEVFVGRAQLPHLDRIIEVQLRVRLQGDDISDQNRVLELEIRRLEEERQRAADLDVAATSGDAGSLVSRELAAGRPDGVLVADGEGIVRECDRGAVELLGARVLGMSLGKIAPGCGLEAFVRDARTAPREGFRFETSTRRDRSARSLMASVMPVTAGEGQRLRVVLLLDLGKRSVATELARANESGIPRQQIGALVEAARVTYVPGAITGTCAVTVGLRAEVSELAPLASPVLLVGERGGGKEFVARIIHYSSLRTGPFLQLRCASLSPEVLEAELFGPAGAETGRPGLLSLAQDGTLFLGEVSDLPLSVQAHLDQVLEEGVMRRPGSKKKERVDCRLIASAPQDLEVLVEKGEFHAGLAARLGTRRVQLTPLRERRGDITELASVFLERFGSGHGVTALSEEARWVMEEYAWPGNVAELEDCVEQACARAESGVIEVGHLTRPLRDHAAELPMAAVIPVTRGHRHADVSSVPLGTQLPTAPQPALSPWMITDEDPISLDLYEKKALLRALDSTGGDKLAAARLLQVGKSTLYRKLKKFAIT